MNRALYVLHVAFSSWKLRCCLSMSHHTSQRNYFKDWTVFFFSVINSLKISAYFLKVLHTSILSSLPIFIAFYDQCLSKLQCKLKNKTFPMFLGCLSQPVGWFLCKGLRTNFQRKSKGCDVYADSRVSCLSVSLPIHWHNPLRFL